MKPYYEKDGITIYHGDCHDTLLRTSFGRDYSVVTDPPYGIGDRMQGGTWGAADKYADFRRWDVAPSSDWLFGLSEGRPSIIWGGNYFCVPPSRCWLVWDKKNSVRTMSDVELAWTNLDRPAKRLSLPVGTHSHGHPTEKPLALMFWCLEFVDGPVLDPFMGSGTTLVAAKQLGRRAVGIEIEERYCEIAARRLDQKVFAFPKDDAPVETQREMFAEAAR